MEAARTRRRAETLRTIALAALVGAGLDTQAPAEDAPRIAARLSAPREVESGLPVSLSIELTRTQGGPPALVPRRDAHWTEALVFAREALALERLDPQGTQPLKQRELPQVRPPLSAMVELPAGESARYTVELRRVFELPALDAGTYRVHLRWSGAADSATFRIVAPRKERRRIARFRSSSAAELHPEEKEARATEVEILVAGMEGERELLARSSYRYSKGCERLAVGGESLARAVAALAVRKTGVKAMEATREAVESDTPERPALCEYAGIAWVESGKLFYTSYGITVPLARGLARESERADGETPDFRQLAPPRALPVEGQVAEIIRVVAREDLIEVALRTTTGEEKLLRVDERGRIETGASK
jgi:hypothetical protein